VGIGSDRRAVLVRAVVVRDDAAGAEVDAFADLRIAEVGEVIGLRAVAEARVLDLDEVADVDVRAEVGAAAHSCERADRCAGRDLDAERFAVDVGEREDRHAVADRRVADHAVRADRDVVAKRDAAFEDAADVDLDISAAGELAAQVEAVGVGESNAALHHLLGLAALNHALERGQLAGALMPITSTGSRGCAATTATPSATAASTTSVR
jgi:hypothetical protein